MSDKMRDPKTGRFVKSGTELSVPVRDSDDEVIETLEERVSYLQEIVDDQHAVIQGFIASGLVHQEDDQTIENLRERLSASARRVHDLEKIIKDQDNLIDQLQRDAVVAISDTVDTSYLGDWTVGIEEEPVVPDPKRGYRLIAWGLVFGGCILFWYGVGQFLFGGK